LSVSPPSTLLFVRCAVKIQHLGRERMEVGNHQYFVKQPQKSCRHPLLDRMPSVGHHCSGICCIDHQGRNRKRKRARPREFFLDRSCSVRFWRWWSQRFLFASTESGDVMFQLENRYGIRLWRWRKANLIWRLRRPSKFSMTYSSPGPRAATLKDGLTISGAFASNQRNNL